MRFVPLIIFLLFACAFTAQAQVQEHRMEQILKPDKDKTFNFNNSTFSGTKNFSAHSAASVKEFQFDQKFSPKAFSTRSFFGAKSSVYADEKFSTKAANTNGKYEIPNLKKAADTKALPVKDYVDSGKKVATKEFAGQRAYLKRGPSQDLFDKEKGVPSGQKPVGWSGDLRPMTIDDVRTLLNKNK